MQHAELKKQISGKYFALFSILPILSSVVVLNVSSDKSIECFMPHNPDLGQPAAKQKPEQSVSSR